MFAEKENEKKREENTPTNYVMFHVLISPVSLKECLFWLHINKWNTYIVLVLILTKNIK